MPTDDAANKKTNQNQSGDAFAETNEAAATATTNDAATNKDTNEARATTSTNDTAANKGANEARATTVTAANEAAANKNKKTNEGTAKVLTTKVQWAYAA